MLEHQRESRPVWLAGAVVPPQRTADSATHLALDKRFLMLRIQGQELVLPRADDHGSDVTVGLLDADGTRPDIFAWGGSSSELVSSSRILDRRGLQRTVHFLPRLEHVFWIGEGDEAVPFGLVIRLLAHNFGLGE